MKLEKDIKEMDIGEEVPINEESLMDETETGRDRHLGDRDMVDMFQIDRDMVAINLGIVIRLGGDRIPEAEKDLDVIDRERQTGLQTLQGVLGASARLVSKLERLW